MIFILTSRMHFPLRVSYNMYSCDFIITVSQDLPRWAKSNMKIVNFFVAIKNQLFTGFSVFTFSKNIRPPLSRGFYRMKKSCSATKCGLLKVRRRFPYKLSSPLLLISHISKLYFLWKYCSEMARIQLVLSAGGNLKTDGRNN